MCRTWAVWAAVYENESTLCDQNSVGLQELTACCTGNCTFYRLPLKNETCRTIQRKARREIWQEDESTKLALWGRRAGFSCNSIPARRSGACVYTEHGRSRVVRCITACLHLSSSEACWNTAATPFLTSLKAERWSCGRRSWTASVQVTHKAELRQLSPFSRCLQWQAQAF